MSDGNKSNEQDTLAEAMCAIENAMQYFEYWRDFILPVHQKEFHFNQDLEQLKRDRDTIAKAIEDLYPSDDDEE